MPTKDPNLWAILLAFYHQHTNAINSFVMAFFIALFRICYVGKERKKLRVLVESTLCGLIAVASESVFDYLQMPIKLSVALGAIVALFGIDKVREMALRYALKKR
ncbi:phage holin, lambda family [Haemophilus parahaemolyticus]|jgi:phage holin, lambda family|uniref:phage holin, lambda family n=1 Tax=Haemophilus parahaemolyticus TaxID=735 RepID=UPI0028D51FDB|nr:phage holin, lambda family [Haemophilus parahaemolyticus]